MELEHHQLELRYAALRVSDPGRRARLLSSLAEYGQQSPVLVVPAGEAYVLVDGYARAEALRALGRDVVEAVVLDLAESDALILAWRLGVPHRRSALEDGWLIAALLELHGLTQREVAQRLQRSVSWVSRRLALTQQLPVGAQAAVRAGLVPAQAAMKCLVPLARAKSEHCERLVAALGGVAVSVRQMERLYLGYKRGDAAVREQIVAQPWLFLKAEWATRPESLVPEEDPATPLLKDLRGIAGLSYRARRRIHDGLLHELDERRRAQVARSQQEVRVAFESLMSLLTEEVLCSTSTLAPPS